MSTGEIIPPSMQSADLRKQTVSAQFPWGQGGGGWGRGRDGRRRNTDVDSLQVQPSMYLQFLLCPLGPIGAFLSRFDWKPQHCGCDLNS